MRFHKTLSILFLLALTFKLNALESSPEGAPCSIVIFGATGDLTTRKLLPALYHLAKEKHLSENSAIVGISRRDLSHQMFRQQMSEAIHTFSRTKPIDSFFLQNFTHRLFYQSTEFEEDAGYENLKELLLEIEKQWATKGNRIFYLATHPNYFPIIIEKLHQHGLLHQPSDSKWSRVIIEKPFGTDSESAIDLRSHIAKYLHPSQVFHVDHFLAKEGVQNLLALRFENCFFEPIWNNHSIDHVQISLCEEIGIGTRGNFWEETGALRDFFQNHLMQLLALVAMDAPSSFTAESIHKEKLKVFQALRPIPLNEIENYFVRGQYGKGMINGQEVLGYRQEKSVSQDSPVETFVAAKFYIDNERWANVPFYIRGGKRLSKHVTEIVITFKSKLTGMANRLFIRIQPEAGVFLKILSKVPGLDTDDKKAVIFGYKLGSSFGLSLPDAYEKLIYDVNCGDKRFFVEAEEQIAVWRHLTPILEYWKNHPSSCFPNYPAGSWGPESADLLMEDDSHQWELLTEEQF